jgi:hypothetical protein
MAESRPPPSSQLPPPPHNNALYVAAALVLVAAIGGIVYFTQKGSARSAAPVVSAPAAATTSRDTIEPPPPPPPIEELAPVASAPTRPAVGGGNTQCSVTTCTGTAPAALQQALSVRATAARGCYERALRVNAALAGKITIRVRVDTAGNVCSAGPVQDQIHSNEVTSCLVGMFKSAKVPPAVGGCADINIPLSFVPKEGK